MYLFAGKKRRSAGSSRKKSDGSRPESTNSPIAKSLSPAEFSPRSPESTAETSTAPNVIMQLLMDAADPDLYAYKGPHESDDISPSPDVLRELVGFYIQYMHPIHGLVDPKASDFWTRLDHPMEPKIAAVVYAMCTIGAIFKSSTPIPGAKPPTPHPGVRDDLVFEFYRRTWTLKDERPRDIVTIQTILMMQSFFDLTSQVEEAASSCRLMAEIADEIGLGAHVLEMGHREKLSMEDILVRNTWKLLVWSEVMGFLISKKSSKITPELRNYCMANGLRCLTEAATLQLANSKELDPNISTPAKLNFMKTLWCIRQFNFALPQDVLNLTLAPYDSVGKTPSSSSTQDVDQMDSTKGEFVFKSEHEIE
ncbi:hypothetical protein EC991_004267 [Linnemannia zychae]|nr:hypothetical protein EC991_004267 [Linnemannia zychae]